MKLLNRIIFLAGWGWSGWIFASTIPSGALPLALQGKPVVVLAVNRADITPAETTAASELSDYLAKITGIPFAIRDEKEIHGGPAIYVGWTAFAKTNGVDFASFGEEESLLRTVDRSVIVGGGRPRGTLYAVYELLDSELGVRWYTPWTEKVPVQPNLALPGIDRRFKPAYEYRFNNAFTSMGGYPFLQQVTLPEHIPTPGVKDTVRWMARNRLNVALRYISTWEPGGKWIDWPEEYGGQVVTRHPANHSFSYFIPDDVYFKTNPEYFSLWDGKRVKQGDHSTGLGMFHLCLSNPELPTVFATNVIAWIKKNPEAYYVAVVPNDASRPMCQCPECEKLALKYMPPGTIRDNRHEAGLILHFVNKVAEIVCTEFPRQRILTLSYNFSEAPPIGIQAHPNVVVQICGGGAATQARINPNVPISSKDATRYAGWAQVCDRLWAWDYQVNGIQSINDNFKPPMWAMDRTFKWLHELGGFTGMFIEAEWNCPPVLPDCYELNTWLSARLLRDPLIDVEPGIRDFCQGYYAAAAPQMLALLDLKRSRLPFYQLRTVNLAFMRRAQTLMAEAEQAAGKDPVILGRLADVRINLDLAALQWRHQIWTEFLAEGGCAEDYPWPMPLLRTRILAALDTSANYWWHQRSAQYWKTSATFNIYINPKLQFREMLPEYIEVICQGPEHMPPVPPELRGIPSERIVDLSWLQLLGNTVTELERDPDSAMGMARCLEMNTPFYKQKGRLPIPLFLYDYSSTVNYAGKKTPDGLGSMSSEVRPEVLKRGGYHWYTAPAGKIGPGTRTVATQSWGHQVNLADLFDPADPDAEWKVYWSIRLTGPNFPFGKVWERDAVLLDRMILVKCVPGETLPDVLGTQSEHE